MEESPDSQKERQPALFDPGNQQLGCGFAVSEELRMSVNSLAGQQPVRL